MLWFVPGTDLWMSEKSRSLVVRIQQNATPLGRRVRPFIPTPRGPRRGERGSPSAWVTCNTIRELFSQSLFVRLLAGLSVAVGYYHYCREQDNAFSCLVSDTRPLSLKAKSPTTCLRSWQSVLSNAESAPPYSVPASPPPNLTPLAPGDPSGNLTNNP